MKEVSWHYEEAICPVCKKIGYLIRSLEDSVPEREKEWHVERHFYNGVICKGSYLLGVLVKYREPHHHSNCNQDKK